jgi:hypothetical protein
LALPWMRKKNGAFDDAVRTEFADPDWDIRGVCPEEGDFGVAIARLDAEVHRSAPA